MSESTSLENLNDIVLPDAVAWWPPAPGWYVLSGLVAVILIYMVWRYWKKARRNRYRKLALHQLACIRKSRDSAELKELPILIKRVALSTWPRREVAALSGVDWHDFLDRTAGTRLFSEGAGQVLDRVSYGVGANSTLADGESNALLDAAEFWLKKHRSEPLLGK